MLADVVELMADDRPVPVHRIGDFAEMRNDLVGRMFEIAASQYGGSVDGHRFDHDHRGAAESALLIIGPMAFAGEPRFRHVGGVSAEDDAVLERHMPQLQGLEKVAKRFRHALSK